MEASDYQDCFSWWKWGVVVFGVDTEAQCRDFAAFIGETDAEKAGVSWEEGGEEA